jgi:hypothetical protein
MMEAASTSETSVDIQLRTRQYIPEDSGLHIYIYIFRHFAWMAYFTYHLVPVLAPNCKQHILSSAKLRKVCYSLAELYVTYVYVNLLGCRGA